MIKKADVKEFLIEFFKLTKVKFYFFALIFIVLQIVPNGYECSLYCIRYFGLPFKLPIILIYDSTNQISSGTIIYFLSLGLLSFIANAILVYLIVIIFAYLVRKIHEKYIKSKINKTINSPGNSIQKNKPSYSIPLPKQDNKNKKPEELKPKYPIKSALR
jgi:hypothetical protein